MATTIVTKSGSGAPTASDLVAGELAVDLTNKRLYTEDSGGTVLELGTNPASDVTFGDNTKAIFGAGSDLQIYHTSTYSAITDVGTGELYIGGDGFVDIGNAALSLTRARFSDSTSALYQQGSIRLATTATGIDVTGTVTADGLVTQATANSYTAGAAQIKSLAGDISYITNVGGDFLISNSSLSDQFVLSSAGNVGIGASVYEGSVTSNASSVWMNPAGYISCNINNDWGIGVNRTGTDGTLANFRKDGVDVGSIGVAAGNRLTISGTSGGTGSGIYFGNTGIVPTDHNGAVSDNTEDMGNASYRWNDAYITNGVTTGSDGNDKQDIETLSDAEQRVAVACKGLLRKWRWKSAVEEKGDEARIHFGIIAQDLQAAFEAEGLDAGRYALFMSNTWTDEETGEERTRLGVRYHELLAFIIAAI